MSRTRQPSTRRIGAAERAVALLDTLAEGGELGTNEIARRTGMTPSTVSRQLGTLAASGLVERVPATGRYRLGLRIVHLANALLARLDVREVARPHLLALVEATGETATLSVPGDDDAITVDFVPGHHQVQPVSRLGRPSIAHATSAGKVMLAFSGRELPEGPLRAYTPRTITDPRKLATEIATVREQGYATAVGEREPDLTAIAAPIRSSRGELEAIVALQGPSSRFGENDIERALPLLRERADAISRELGWRPPEERLSGRRRASPRARGRSREARPA
jgi:IclR family acetate operon transcriptional repressor